MEPTVEANYAGDPESKPSGLAQLPVTENDLGRQRRLSTPTTGWQTMNDDELLRRFEDCTLPIEHLDHRGHVKVAFLYLRAHPFDFALSKLRDGIKKYNASQGTLETKTSGYNETTTRAFLHLIAATMQAYGDMFPTPNADAFCDRHPQLLSKHLLRLFYSPARRMHPDAKAEFVSPDLTPLPRMNDDRGT